jgi:amino acid transporter
MSTPSNESDEADTGAPKSGAPVLLRTMGLTSLVIYGVGDMVGSGIYGTVGDAAKQLGNAVWLAFVVSMVAAMLTGLSYACIASRYPRAAGAAYVTQRAFQFAFLSYLIGLTVTASGLTSMATSTNVFARTMHGLAGWPWLLTVAVFLGFMTFVNFWGIRQSMWTNIVCTAVEVGGLLFIIGVGVPFWGSVDYLETPARLEVNGHIVDHGLTASTLLGGAVLTFFSFIGFEDMLNVAEEVKEPKRTMPWGIVLALVVATFLYIGVAVTSVSVVPHQDLSKPGASALARVAGRAAPWLPARTYDFITLFAVANTVLINYIMGSRLLYGMARQGLLPSVLGRVHPRRHTPHIAIFTLLVMVLVLAISGGDDAVKQLAYSTGLLLLFSFMVVNAALIVLKLRPGEPPGAFEVPILVPALGILINATLITARLADPVAGGRAPMIVGVIVLAIAALYFIMRPENITEESLAAAEQEG